MARSRYKYKRGSRVKVRITKGRLKGETGTAIGDSNLNMEYVIIISRDNKKARNPIMGFAPR